MTESDFRIAPAQALAAKAKQALMIGADELRLFTYYSPYQLGDADQRASLLHTLEEQWGATISLPEAPTGVFYLVVVDDEPVLVPESDALPFTLAIALATGGPDLARQVSYRPEMLPISRR